jgi:hypothetical protein
MLVVFPVPGGPCRNQQLGNEEKIGREEQVMPTGITRADLFASERRCTQVLLLKRLLCLVLEPWRLQNKLSLSHHIGSQLLTSHCYSLWPEPS